MPLRSSSAQCALILCFVFSILSFCEGVQAHTFGGLSDVPVNGVSYTVLVYDADHNVPLELARVALRRQGALVAGKVTDIAGRAAFRDIQPGRYTLVVSYVGYQAFTDTVLVDATHSFDSIALREIGGEEITIGASSEPPITTFDPTTGNQIFESESYHAAPTARMTELVQQNMMGAVRAPTGEVHIRGQHGEFTYYVDGAPIPLGVFGGLNEVVNPQVIQRAIFWNGGWSAEYGGQMAAIVDVQNRVPAGRFHLDASTYAGSYLPGEQKDQLMHPSRFLNSNGQQLSISDNYGKLGFFLSGSRQETDRRIDPPIQTIFHDHGFDYFLYGKADYILSATDYLTLNLNYGKTLTQVPFDSVEEGIKDDQQQTTNGFQTLSYYHTISSENDKESNLLVSGFAREGGLVFTPGAVDQPAFRFQNDTSHSYVIAEDRSFTTFGVRTKFEDRLSHMFLYALGGSFTATSGTENFSSRDASLIAGPSVTTDYRGSDFGLFAQTEWHPLEWTSLDLGVRYDQHIAPDVPLESQISPRVKWDFLIGDNDNAYIYFGRLFMPNNIEGLRSLSSNVAHSGVGTVAERSNFYEAVYSHSFEFGLRAKAAYFRKDSKPGVDDQTVGSSAVKTPVNIESVHVQGIDLGLSFSSPETPLSGYLNASVIHAYSTLR